MTRIHMAALAAALAGGLVTLAGQAQNSQAPGRPPAPNADPYANNPDAGTQKFPLAAPAGKDSGAATTPPELESASPQPGAAGQAAPTCGAESRAQVAHESTCGMATALGALIALVAARFVLGPRAFERD